MKKIQKIFYLVLVFVALFTIVACRNKNKKIVKEYSYNYDISFSDEGYSLEQLIAQIESANNVSFNGASFDVSNSNAEVVEYANGSFVTKNTGASQVVLTNEGKVIPQNEDKNITITVILTLGDNYMEKTFDMVVKKYDPDNKLHQLTIYASEIDLSKQEGLRLVNDRIELEEGLLEATEKRLKYYMEFLFQNYFPYTLKFHSFRFQVF